MKQINENTYESISGDNDGFLLSLYKNDVLFDVTGYTYFLTIKKYLENDSTDDTAILKKEVVGDSSGQVSLVWNGSETQDLSGYYYFDIQQKSPDGKITTLLLGRIRFVSDVTNRTS